MARLIDDDKVKMQLTMVMSMHMPLNTKYMIVPIDNFVQNIIQNATVGEVVRCKDCIHYIRNIPCVGGSYNGCEMIEGRDGNEYAINNESFYCEWGERREDE